VSVAASAPTRAARARALRLRLPTSRLTVAAKAWGREGELPVLAVHGWLDNAASFDRLAPLLPGTHLVAFDLPGHGLSQHRPPGVAYHFVDWLADLADVARALGWQRYVLMGHSLGAGIAALYAGARPDEVQSLVLLDGLGPLSGTAEEQPARVAQALSERTRLWGRRHPVYADRSMAEKALAEVAGHRNPLTTRLLVARGMRRVDGGWVWRHDRRVRGGSPMRLTEEQVVAFLRRVTCPTLLVWNDGGFPWDKEQMQARARALPHAEVHELPGGHHLHADEPEAVAPLVRAHLQALGGG
jgi:pimeloyl-ACP methyl ester carboxylesterase